jgi:hypothetical protein
MVVSTGGKSVLIGRNVVKVNRNSLLSGGSMVHNGEGVVLGIVSVVKLTTSVVL